MTAGIELDGRDMLVRAPSYPSKELGTDGLGGRWDKEAKAWRLAPTSLNMLRIGEFYGEEFLRTAPEVLQDLAFERWGFAGFSDDERARAEAHTSWGTLFEFQREAVEYMFCNPHAAALLSIPPGYGKTAVSTVAADLLEFKRVLVLAPVTLTKNWRREIDKWESGDREVKRAISGVDRSPGTEVTIANHEVIQEVVLRDEDGRVFQPDWVTNARKVKEWIEDGEKKENTKTGKMVPVRERITRVRRDYLEVDWDVIIVDESILLKNRKAVKADVLKTLTQDSNAHVWMLSGSPTSKYRDDLWKQLNIIFPRGFSSYWRFAEFFCVVDKGGWGWSIEGDAPDVDPHHYLRDFFYVPDPETLPKIPGYIYRPIEIDLHKKQRKAFDEILNGWVTELEDGTLEVTNWLSMSTRLQQITSNMCSLPGETKSCSAKEDLLVELIKQGDLDTPLLVWAWFVDTAKSVKDRLESEFKDLRVGLVYGEMKTADKDDTIDAYKNGDLDVIVLQMNVGKFGHTLTNTKTVFYHDRSFDADAWIQSYRRVPRLGLEHTPVLVIPKCDDSIDELVDQNLAGKFQSIAKLSKADLASLLKSLGTIGFTDELPTIDD